MNRQTVITHALIMLASVGLAFWAVNSDKSTKNARGEINILNVEKGSLREVFYTWPKGDLALKLVGEKRQKNVFATLEHERSGTEKKAWLKEAGKDEEASEEVPRKTYRFPVNDSAKKSLSRLTPFIGKRSLGEVSGKSLKQMGLDPVVRTLKIVWDKGEATFDVGETTYGNRARYIRERGKNDVYLVPGDAIKGLEGTPPRLQEARVFGLDIARVQTMTLKEKSEERRYDHFNPDDSKNRFLALKGSDEKDDAATNLLRTLRTLRVVRYLDQDALKELQPSHEVKFVLRDIDDLEVAFFEAETVPKFRATINGFPALLDENRGAQAKEELDEIFATSP